MLPQLAYRRAYRLWSEAPASPLQRVSWPTFDKAGVILYLKRDDLLHPHVSGNKWRKLLPQVAWLLRGGALGFATVGGQHSNHLAAVAALCQTLGVPCIGYVRGGFRDTPTLAFAKTCGMRLVEATRAEVKAWRGGGEPVLPKGYQWLPEGGSSKLGTLGLAQTVREIYRQLPADIVRRGGPSGIGVAIGSGGTTVGLARKARCCVYATQVVQDSALSDRIRAMLPVRTAPLLARHYDTKFASGEPLLHDTMERFYDLNRIELDPIYTVKAFLGLEAWLNAREFPRGSTVVLVHTGGLQGAAAWRARYGY